MATRSLRMTGCKLYSWTRCLTQECCRSDLSRVPSTLPPDLSWPHKQVPGRKHARGQPPRQSLSVHGRQPHGLTRLTERIRRCCILARHADPPGTGEGNPPPKPRNSPPVSARRLPVSSEPS